MQHPVAGWPIHLHASIKVLHAAWDVRSLPAAQRAFHDWHHHSHEFCLGELGVATCRAAHARVGTLYSGALVLPVCVPTIPMLEMPALGHMPPDGILADRLQADGTGLLLLRGRAKLVSHTDGS